MPIYRLATSVQMDSLLPRDAVMINPVINDTVPPTDPQQLCDDWATIIKTFAAIGTQGQITVKAYDVQQAKPNPPKATKILNVGTFLTSGYPRELALCLSFFSEYNVQRRRGRVYIPVNWMQGVGTPSTRPAAGFISKVATLATSLQNLGGADCDWSVYSKVDNTARAVTNWFVDDEWDTQRPRGLRTTTRTVGTTSELTT